MSLRVIDSAHPVLRILLRLPGLAVGHLDLALRGHENNADIFFAVSMELHDGACSERHRLFGGSCHFFGPGEVAVQTSSARLRRTPA